MIKRGIISVYRNKTRSIIYGAILLAISVLVLTGLSIKSATLQSMEQAKQELNAQVTLGVNIEQVVEEMLNNGYTMQEIKGNWREHVTPVTSDFVSVLADSEYVIDYNYVVNTEFTVTDLNTYNYYGAITDEENNLGVVGTYSSGLLNEFASSYEIVEGSLFDGSESGVVVLSSQLADINQLEIGDALNITANNTVYPLEIVGLFETVDAYYQPTLFNQIFVSIEDVLTIKEMSEENGFEVEGTVLYLDDPSHVEAYYEEVSSEELIANGTFLLADTNDIYEAMVEPLRNVSELVDFILVAIIIAGLVVITLLIGNGMKDRKYEIGVLLSLGEQKTKIAFQYVFEMLLIGYVAFAIGIFASQTIANDIGNTLISNMSEETVSEEGIANNTRRGRAAAENIDLNVAVIDEIDVKVNNTEIILMYVIGSSIIIGASLIPSYYISRYQPKIILSSGN